MKKLSFFLVMLLGVCLVFSFAVNTVKGKPAFVSDEVVVKFTPDANLSAIKVKYGLIKKADSHKKGQFVVFKHANPQAILSQLKNEPGIIYAEQNAIAYALLVPNDPHYSPYQWHMTRIGMEEAWDMNTGNGVVVAVIDTGVKQSLEDLANTNFTAGYDFINNDNDPTDDDGHGSHVCGTIAQSTNNNIGVTGIAYNSTIMPVKVLDQNGSGSYTGIANGIYYATDNGADIINLSLGGSSNLSILQDACEYAWNNGVVVVCAAGNSSTSSPFYPAAYTVCISVSATNYLDELADYSNYGSTIDICAPGGDSDDNNGDGYMDGVLQNTFGASGDGYYFYTGTSMASPHVAGVAALVKCANPALTNTQIRNILETTAEDIGASGWDQYFGNGIVDAPAAVQAAGGGGNQYPVADFTFSTNLLTATFTDQSYDPDGTIVSWYWTFGDSGTSAAQNPVHTYAASGTYPVTLTVTDNEGATDDITKDITVSDGTTPEIYVFDISQSIKKRGRNYNSNATVTIKDTDGNVVPNATAFITWSGAVSGSYSGVTGAAGTVSFTSAKVKSTGPFTITVTNVTHATMDYNSALNNETTDTVNY